MARRMFQRHATVSEILKRIGCEPAPAPAGIAASTGSAAAPSAPSPDACCGCMHKCAQLEATVAGLCEENDSLWAAVDQLKLALAALQGHTCDASEAPRKPHLAD